MGSSSKLSPMSAGNMSLKTPIRCTTPKTNLPSPAWSKGCLRPHSPLRPRQQGTLGSHSTTMSGTNVTGSPIPSSISAGGINDPSMTPNESGPNRTLKRFMTMKKSKANEFLKRGKKIFRPFYQTFNRLLISWNKWRWFTLTLCYRSILHPECR